MEDKRATVVVSRERSYCFECGGKVVPDGMNVLWHQDRAGYNGKLMGGCQRIWKARSSDQDGVDENTPGYEWGDLPWVDYRSLFEKEAS